MTDDDPRTVADVTQWPRTDEARALWRHILATPYDDLRRRLEMGERAEQAHAYDTIFVRDMADPYRIGWNGCLDHIRGDR